jgi:F0F1-type ATP synthase membrane subunit b/b'
MIVVTRNWKVSLIGLAVSVGIFLVLFFTVIQPSTNTANAAIKSGEKQTQQAIKQASKQLNHSDAAAAAAGGQSASATKKIDAATKQANKQLNQAGKLAACVSAAGTDPSKLASCQTKFS